jgi:regulator of replication initiation timing
MVLLCAFFFTGVTYQTMDPEETHDQELRGHARTESEDQHGHARTNSAGMSGMSGWVTTEVAARAVRVSPRTIRRLIDRGELRAKAEGQGVERRWLVDVDSLYALRSSRPETRNRPGSVHGPDAAAGAPDSVADVLRELAARVEERTTEAVEMRIRLELSEQAQSTIEEEARRLRQENERLRQELEALSETRENSETASDEAGKGTPREKPEPSQRRSWLRRFFFGPD